MHQGVYESCHPIYKVDSSSKEREITILNKYLTTHFSINELLHYYRCVRSGEIHTLIIQDKILSYSLSYNYIIKRSFL